MRHQCLFFLLIAVMHPVPAAPVLRKPPADFDAFVSSEMAARRIPGLSIGYAQDGITWARGYGFADLENRVPARADSSYRLASVTKPMTATAIMRLVEQGKVELDAEVQTYVPYFPRKPYPITVRQLLGHLGGINAYVNPVAEQHFKEHKNTRQSLAVFQDFDLVAEPGARFRYTSYGYNLLGAVIEGASGQSYGDYMHAAIWGPLGMASTRLDDPLALIPHRVRGYQLVGSQLQHSEFVDISSRFSAGGTRSSVVDMLRFGQGISQGRLLSRSSLATMETSMATKNGELTGYGMGWQTRPIDGKFVISHDGMQPETSTYLFVFPARRFSIAVAANLQRVDLTAFAARLFESVTGEAWQLTPYIRQQAHRPYYRAMQALYNEGRGHAEAGRPPISGDAAAISAAFAAINDNAAAANASQLRLAGSAMAQALARSGMKLRSYSNIGAIGFARDYIAVAQPFRMDSASRRPSNRRSERCIPTGRAPSDSRRVCRKAPPPLPRCAGKCGATVARRPIPTIRYNCAKPPSACLATARKPWRCKQPNWRLTRMATRRPRNPCSARQQFSAEIERPANAPCARHNQLNREAAQAWLPSIPFATKSPPKASMQSPCS
jgi:CubicO group peptidase (beta-lactamase class C family)